LNGFPASIPSHDAVNQLFDRWDEAIGIKWIGREFIRIMSGEREIVVNITTVRNILQGFLDAKAARIGKSARGMAFILCPGGKTAM
jgi:hypothetical protein